MASKLHEFFDLIDRLARDGLSWDLIRVELAKAGLSVHKETIRQFYLRRLKKIATRRQSIRELMDHGVVSTGKLEEVARATAPVAAQGVRKAQAAPIHPPVESTVQDSKAT